MKTNLLSLLLTFALAGAAAAGTKPGRRMSYTGAYLPDGGSSPNGPDAAALEGFSKGANVPRPRPRRPHVYVSSVRSDEAVKVYGIGRYVDTSDGRMLHERHAVYRLEESPGWRLQPPAHQPEVLMGPIVGLRHPEYAPEPLPGEVGRDLVTAQESSRQAVQDVQAVTQDQVKIRKDLEENFKRVNQNEEALMRELGALRQQINAAAGPAATAGAAPTPAPAANAKGAAGGLAAQATERK